MFECMEIPSLIPERYEEEMRLVFNNDDILVNAGADMPYERKMELLHEQRMGELKKARILRLLGSIALVFVLICVIVSKFSIEDWFPVELAYSAFAVIVATVALLVQWQFAHIGIINSRMGVLATENASRRNSTPSPPRERREKATCRNAAAIEPE